MCELPSTDYINLIFEAASALDTVGLSNGITFDLSSAEKMILTALMYIGRVGVLTIGFAMLLRMKKRTKDIFKQDDLAV